MIIGSSFMEEQRSFCPTIPFGFQRMLNVRLCARKRWFIHIKMKTYLSSCSTFLPNFSRYLSLIHGIFQRGRGKNLLFVFLMIQLYSVCVSINHVEFCARNALPWTNVARIRDEDKSFKNSFLVETCGLVCVLLGFQT